MREVIANTQPTDTPRAVVRVRIVERLIAVCWRAVFYFAIPLALTALLLRFALPSSGQASGTLLSLVTRAASANVLIFAVCIFLLLTLMLRYWRHRLPGFRLTLPRIASAESPVPGADLRLLEEASVVLRRLTMGPVARRRMARLTREGSAFTETSISELNDAFVNVDFVRMRKLAPDLKSFARFHPRDLSASEWVMFLLAGAAPILLALAFRTQIIQPCRISGRSMLPTLEGGDSIGLRPSAYRTLLQAVTQQASNVTPMRGDIVVFDNPERGVEEYLVKRVIGLPGDYVRMKDGLPVINGWSVPYCDAGIYANLGADHVPIQGRLIVEFLAERAYLTLYKSSSAPTAYDYEFRVKDHEVFVLGDNRNESLDSRTWNKGLGGGVPVNNIRGRAEWFLMGTARARSIDYTRLMNHLGTQPHIEGLNSSNTITRISECLRKKPAHTWPPATVEGRVTSQVASR